MNTPIEKQTIGKHTTGPWIAGGYDGPFARKVTTERKPMRWIVTVVTNAYDGGSKSSEAVAVMEANARLVSAAPELLEAAESALMALEGQKAADDGYTVHEKAIAKLTAVISKVKGL